MMNLFTDCIKMLVYIVVCKAKHFRTILLKNVGSFAIIFFALLCVMLRTVQLDHKPCLRTIKVNDKGFNDPLFVDFYRIITQKYIP